MASIGRFSESETLLVSQAAGEALATALVSDADALASIVGKTTWYSGHLGLRIGSNKWIIIFPRSTDLEFEGIGTIEVLHLGVSHKAELPTLHQWPGGPEAPWCTPLSLGQLEGCLITAVTRRTRTTEVVLPNKNKTETISVDSGLLFEFSGGRSLLAEASEEVPMALEIEVRSRIR